MDVFKTHGAFSWSELMTGDPAAAADFYGGLFGWRIETIDMGMGPYRVAKVGDASVAGIMQTPADAGPLPPHWGVYVTVDDVDAALQRAGELGGRVCVPATDIPGVGRMGVVADPQGAMISLMQYASPAAG